MEPTLLLPMGFGAIIVNLPGSAIAADGGIIRILYDCGIANEFFPLVLFIGIGAMIDFGPVLTNPKLMLFGAAAQFGIFSRSAWQPSAGSVRWNPLPLR